jgi:hypothetical protein
LSAGAGGVDRGGMSWRRRGAWFLTALVVASLALEVYARLPSRIAVAPLALPPATRHAILLFHGRNGRDEPTLAALTRRFGALAAARPATIVRSYVWSPHSDTRFRSERNGARIGTVLGAELGAMPALESVHLVGHSAGAFVLDALCEALRSSAQHPVRIDVTYLDPIGFRGAFDAGWGARHYGECADYAEAFINTDDPVPATNAPLAHAFNIDVTGAGRRARFEGGGHRWPVRYYLGQLGIDDVIAGSHGHATRPRGAVEQR